MDLSKIKKAAQSVRALIDELDVMAREMVVGKHQPRPDEGTGDGWTTAEVEEMLLEAGARSPEMVTNILADALMERKSLGFPAPASEDQGGLKFDDGKPRMDLVPVEGVRAVARALAFGLSKGYPERNWEKGLDWGRTYAAALRHLMSWWEGETEDPESGLNHLDHAACNLFFLIEFTYQGTGTDNRPKGE